MIYKKTLTAYILFFFFGALGAHKFYIKRIGMGVLYLFTGGFLGIGLLIDLFTLGTQVKQYNLEQTVLMQGSKP